MPHKERAFQVFLAGIKQAMSEVLHDIVKHRKSLDMVTPDMLENPKFVEAVAVSKVVLDMLLVRFAEANDRSGNAREVFEAHWREFASKEAS